MNDDWIDLMDDETLDEAISTMGYLGSAILVIEKAKEIKSRSMNPENLETYLDIKKVNTGCNNINCTNPNCALHKKRWAKSK